MIAAVPPVEPIVRVRLRRCTLAVVPLLVLAAGGCGNGTQKPQALPGAAQQPLTRTDVDRYPAGTPQRALLHWWRDAQYVNLAGYLDDFQPAFRRVLRQDRKTLRGLAWFAGSIRPARPTIQNIEVRGNTATIYTRVAYRTPVGLSRFVTSTAPQAFVLVRRRGRWLLHDDNFVQSTLPPQLQRRS
ncbi:MAG: hypothetical protein V7644_193 [Actinomycetota bacterium]|jgi:hypothetical protein